MDARQLREHLRTAPPSCMKHFNTKPASIPIPFDHHTCAAWKLACRCGGGTGRMLGYPLADYNPDYHGPEIFVSPLAFECATCGETTPLLDTECDGYHAVLSRLEGGTGSSKIRGRGQAKAYSCPACGSESFDIAVGFVFWDVDELAEEFDGNWEELFNEFLCRCTCVHCGRTSEPTQFGKL